MKQKGLSIEKTQGRGECFTPNISASAFSAPRPLATGNFMEGPQTRALAEVLHGALTAAPVDRIDVPEHRWQANMLLMNCVGQVIQQVHSYGKWIFFDFSHGISWACHLLAQSTWRVHVPRDDGPERFIRADSRPPLIRMILRNGNEGILTGRPILLTLPTETLMNHAQLKDLGPDPLNSKFQPELFLTRLRSAANRALASALTDQHVIAGIGNRLKCEILFTARLAPDIRLADLYASQLSSLVDPIQKTMRAEYDFYLSHGVNESPSSAVYDRAGESCHVCGSEIMADRNAGDGHWTWYCPACQKTPPQPTLFDK